MKYRITIFLFMLYAFGFGFAAHLAYQLHVERGETIEKIASHVESINRTLGEIKK